MLEQLVFQKKLQEILVEAKLKNSAYSLRAYARRLGMAPSALSEILNGKRKVSKKMAERTVRRLALSPEEISKIISMFPDNKVRRAKKTTTEIADKEKSEAKEKAEEQEEKKEKKKEEKKEKQPPEDEKREKRMALNMDQFHLISEWYHLAILSLVQTADFKSDCEWIAKRLNIKLVEAKTAISRLVRLGMLMENEQHQLKVTGHQHPTSDEITDLALRHAHTVNLNLAQVSLERDTADEMDFSSMTMAIDQNKIPEAKKMIRDFKKNLCDFLESGRKNQVYKICINFFPLSNLHLNLPTEEDNDH